MTKSYKRMSFVFFFNKVRIKALHLKRLNSLADPNNLKKCD